MSDLTATQCGCQRSDNQNGCGGILWIIILFALCGCNGNDSGCGSGLFGGGGSDCGCESILILILLLSCCGGCSF